MNKTFLLFLLILCNSSWASPKLSHIVRQSLLQYCHGRSDKSLLAQEVFKLAPSHKRCKSYRFIKKESYRPIKSLFLKTSGLHVHLPKLRVIEEEDDFFNDDIYMWFIITVDGIPYSKVTKIYRGLDEGETLLFDDQDRVINSFPYKRQLIIDWGIVESDGEDITEMQRLSTHAFKLISIVLEQADSGQRQTMLAKLREETNAVMQLLLGLSHDDRLTNGTLVLDVHDTYRLWQNNGFLEQQQVFSGNHMGSDWKYQLTWRFLMVDIGPPALF